MVGTPTFRHGNGENNFVQKEKPLGWEYGSDGSEISLGVEMLDFIATIVSVGIGLLLGTMLIDWYRKNSL